VTEPGSVKLLADIYAWQVSILLLNTTHIRMTLRLIFWYKNWERNWEKICFMYRVWHRLEDDSADGMYQCVCSGAAAAVDLGVSLRHLSVQLGQFSASKSWRQFLEFRL
jgi:hypothetical protein